MVGVLENLAGTYIPGVGNELKLPIALAMIVTVLVFKPNGLFGRVQVQRVLTMSTAQDTAPKSPLRTRPPQNRC